MADFNHLCSVMLFSLITFPSLWFVHLLCLIVAFRLTPRLLVLLACCHGSLASALLAWSLLVDSPSAWTVPAHGISKFPYWAGTLTGGDMLTQWPMVYMQCARTLGLPRRNTPFGIMIQCSTRHTAAHVPGRFVCLRRYTTAPPCSANDGNRNVRSASGKSPMQTLRAWRPLSYGHRS